MSGLTVDETEERQRAVRAMPVPKVGDDIYVPSYGDRTCGYQMGGLARVSEVLDHVRCEEPSHYICVEEFPDSLFSWEYLLAEEQDALREKFGERRVHEC